MIVLLIFQFLIKFKFSEESDFGNPDSKLCQVVNTSLSCNHQLKNIFKYDCSVHYFSPKDCLIQMPHTSFDHLSLPFNLNVYQFSNNFLELVVLNISFPNPSWKEMVFHIENVLLPKYKFCRRITLDLRSSFKNTQELSKKDPQINGTIYWDCIVFDVGIFEENYYRLYLKDDRNAGGIYSFRMPALKHYDIKRTPISNWHVFFFVDESRLKYNDKVVLSFQMAPFKNISYSILLVKCLDDADNCYDMMVVNMALVKIPSESAKLELITVGLDGVLHPGIYKIKIRIVSALCVNGLCSTSDSPTFQIERNYVLDIALIVSVISCVTLFATYVFIKKIYTNFSDYVTNCTKNSNKVLFVYHANSKNELKFLQNLAKFFASKFYVSPKLIDDHLGTEDPTAWTREQMTSCSKILFFLPSNLTAENASPIQLHWRYAVNFCISSRHHFNVSKKCGVISFDVEKRACETDRELRNFRRFKLPNDTISLINWLHRDKSLDRFFWKSTVSPFTGNFKSLIRRYFEENFVYEHSDVSDFRFSIPKSRAQEKSNVSLNLNGLTCQSKENGLNNQNSKMVDNFEGTEKESNEKTRLEREKIETRMKENFDENRRKIDSEFDTLIQNVDSDNFGNSSDRDLDSCSASRDNIDNCSGSREYLNSCSEDNDGGSEENSSVCFDDILKFAM